MKQPKELAWKQRETWENGWTEADRAQLRMLTFLSKVGVVLLAGVFLLLFLFLCFEIMR